MDKHISLNATENLLIDLKEGIINELKEYHFSKGPEKTISFLLQLFQTTMEEASNMDGKVPEEMEKMFCEMSYCMDIVLRLGEHIKAINNAEEKIEKMKSI